MTSKTKKWLLRSCVLLLLMPGVMDAEESKGIVRGRRRGEEGEAGSWRRGGEGKSPPPADGEGGWWGRMKAGTEWGVDGIVPLRKWGEEPPKGVMETRERRWGKRGEEGRGGWRGEPAGGRGHSVDERRGETADAGGPTGKALTERGEGGGKGNGKGEEEEGKCRGEGVGTEVGRGTGRRSASGGVTEREGRKVEGVGETTESEGKLAKRKSRGRGTKEGDNDLSPAEGLTTDPTKRLTSGRGRRKNGWNRNGKEAEGVKAPDERKERGHRDGSDPGDFTEENECPREQSGKCRRPEDAMAAIESNQTADQNEGDAEGGSRAVSAEGEGGEGKNEATTQRSKKGTAERGGGESVSRRGNGFAYGFAGEGIQASAEGGRVGRGRGITAMRAMAGAHEASAGGQRDGEGGDSSPAEEEDTPREWTGWKGGYVAGGTGVGDQGRGKDNKVNNHPSSPKGSETRSRQYSALPLSPEESGAGVNCKEKNYLSQPPAIFVPLIGEKGWDRESIGRRSRGERERIKNAIRKESRDSIGKTGGRTIRAPTGGGGEAWHDGEGVEEEDGEEKTGTKRDREGEVTRRNETPSVISKKGSRNEMDNRRRSPEIEALTHGEKQDGVEEPESHRKIETAPGPTRRYKIANEIESDAPATQLLEGDESQGDKTEERPETMKHSNALVCFGEVLLKGCKPSDYITAENSPAAEGGVEKGNGAVQAIFAVSEVGRVSPKHDGGVSSGAITRHEIPSSVFDKGSPVVADREVGNGERVAEEGLMDRKTGNRVAVEGTRRPKIPSPRKFGISTRSKIPAGNGNAKGLEGAIRRRAKDVGDVLSDESEDVERLPDFLPDSSAVVGGGREMTWRVEGRGSPHLRKDGVLKEVGEPGWGGEGVTKWRLRGPGRTLMSIPEEDDQENQISQEPPHSATIYANHQRGSADTNMDNSDDFRSDSTSEEKLLLPSYSPQRSEEDSMALPVGPPRAADFHPVQGVKFVARQDFGGRIMYIVEGTGVRVRRWKPGEYGEDEGTRLHHASKNKREAGKNVGRAVVERGGIYYHRENGRLLGISIEDKNSSPQDRRNSRGEIRMGIHSESFARKETRAAKEDAIAKDSRASGSQVTKGFKAIKSDPTRKDDTLAQGANRMNAFLEPTRHDYPEDRLSLARNGGHADAKISAGGKGRGDGRQNQTLNKPLVGEIDSMGQTDPSHSTPTTSLHPFDREDERELFSSTTGDGEYPSASPPLVTESSKREELTIDNGFYGMQGKSSLRYQQMLPPTVGAVGSSRPAIGNQQFEFVPYASATPSNQTTVSIEERYATGSNRGSSGENRERKVQLSRKPRTLDSSFGRGRAGGRGSGGDRLVVSHTLEDDEKGTLTVGMILPHVAFGQREYTRAINSAISGLQRSRGRKLEFFKKYNFAPAQVRSTTMKLTPSPTAILNSLCKEFLSVNVSAILYLMNYEKYGRSTASAQYFLQLAGYLGIPVIAWNADNSGLERRASQSSLQLQLAPSLEHQTAAMLSILERYKWHQFSIVTSQIAGHDDFVQAVRERILDMQDVFKFTILNAVLVTKPSDLSELVNSESRVVLLYCTRDEALRILAAAADYKITGENYVWVAAQSVIENRQPLPQFPVGMLGVHFDTSMASLVTEIATAVKVYAYGVEDFVNDPRNEKLSLNTQLSCEGAGDSRWKVGDRFFKYLRNVSVEGDHGKPNIEFTADGVLKAAELKIMNLRPGVSKQLQWEEIGVWKSWEREGLDIKDIVWPGGSHTPPQGVPEKFHMRITFLEEPPYINVAPPDPITGKCSINRGVLCRFAADSDMSGLDVTQAHRNASYYQCCSGFCIDLLEKFSEELGFTYELVRVEDGKWGTLENGKWNGLIADLINRKTDMVMTSLMINSDREAVVDFTVPFMESGIAIVVAKRTGIISPTAFLEPFDTASWMLVGFVAIQASAFTIFLFEWLSPSGFDMKVAPSTNHRFSLFRTYWLVWAVLFQAAVHVDCPKGFTARFMTNVWAMFAVVFLAIYTANLAAFMITREEFHEFSGIDDHRLAKPFSHKPMYKFGTIPSGHTDSTLKKYFREMHAYMKRHNRSVVSEGIEAVLSGELDAFIYDGTVLDYLVSQDEDCRLLTVGSWYAMTGYGLAFQRNSKYVRMFNQRLLDFRENGDLERLRRYWMTGSCKPGKQERKSSDPLALEQFLSAFLLLMSGILLAAVLLLLEHLYFKYVRHHLARTDRGGCCALISLSMGKSLTFRGAVYEAQDMYRNNRYRGRHQQPQHPGGHRAFAGGGRTCGCSYCEGLHNLWATRRELEACRLRIRHLEKQMEAHGIRPLPPPPPQSLPSLLPLPGSSPGNRRYLNDEDALRTRDMTRNHVTSTEYCGQLYRPCRTEIAEMETVL